MSDSITMILPTIVGLALGTIFFGGLWWTIRMGLASDRAAVWFLGSLLVRTGIVLAGFYFTGKDDWKRMAACLVGFIIARFAVTWLTRQSGDKKKEAYHAP